MKKRYSRPTIELIGDVAKFTKVGNSTPQIDPGDAKNGSNPNGNAQ